MLRYLYRLALPGGRKVMLVYYPAHPPQIENPTPLPPDPEPHFDAAMGRLGYYGGIKPDTGLFPIAKHIKRTR